MEKTIPVQNIHCHHCVQSIRTEVGEIPGVEAVAVDAETGRVTVKWEAPATWEQVVQTLEDIGYPPGT